MQTSTFPLPIVDDMVYQFEDQEKPTLQFRQHPETADIILLEINGSPVAPIETTAMAAFCRAFLDYQSLAV